MLKVIKTTTMTTLAALSLTATFGTTANAQSFNNNNNDRVCLLYTSDAADE